MPDEADVRTVRGEDHDLVLLRGPLSPATARLARDAVEKALAQRGRALVDVSGLVLDWGPVITVFSTALSAAGGWPVARMVLFGVPAPLLAALRRARVPDTVPVAADEAEAARLLDVRPARVRRHRDLPAALAAPQAARTYLTDTCAEWDVPDGIRDAVVQMASELVTNAVQHARTPSRLTVGLDAGRMIIGVRDHLRVAASGPVRRSAGYGLRLVEELAGTWSVTPHPDGKTVWASLPVP